MYLYTPEKVYLLDRAAVEVDGLSEVELMGRAGQRVLLSLLERWPNLSSITVFVGPGNNGGDALVVAQAARARDISVQCLVMGDMSRQSETSQYYRRQWEQAGGSCDQWKGQAIDGEVIVDGLLGIGLQRELNEEWQLLITGINQAPVPRVAIDIPSGLSGLRGQPQPVAVNADLTVTFIGLKTGQYLADGPDYCGEIIYDDLGVSRRVLESEAPTLEIIETCRLPEPRRRNSHKNMFGHLLVVGGAPGMSGAAALASKAALRAGAGLVTALVHRNCLDHLSPVPEVMALDWTALESKLDAASVIVVGPGLGDSKAASKCLDILSQCELPMVVDASALDNQFLSSLKSTRLVITPHPGEAAALLHKSAGKVQADRVASCIELSSRYNATCVLKGSGTLIASPDGLTAINTSGNPGMAGAGMGDVLAGLIAAFMGQGMSAFEAAKAGVFLHAGSADRYARESDQIGLVASDLIDGLPSVIKSVRDTG